MQSLGTQREADIFMGQGHVDHLRNDVWPPGINVHVLAAVEQLLRTAVLLELDVSQSAFTSRSMSLGVSKLSTSDWPLTLARGGLKVDELPCA